MRTRSKQLRITARLRRDRILRSALLSLLRSMIITIRRTTNVLRIRIVNNMLTPKRTRRCLRMIRLCIMIKQLQVSTFRFRRLFLRSIDGLSAPFLLRHLLTRLDCVLVLRTTTRLVLSILRLLLRRMLTLLLISIFANTRLCDNLRVNRLRLTIRSQWRICNALLRQLLLRRLRLLLSIRKRIKTCRISRRRTIDSILSDGNYVLLRVFITLSMTCNGILTIICSNTRLTTVTTKRCLYRYFNLSRRMKANENSTHRLRTLRTLRSSNDNLIKRLRSTCRTDNDADLMRIFRCKIFNLK